MDEFKNISIIGSGNVATHLSKSLYKAGIKIIEVFSRNIENATFLANQVGAKAVNNLEHLSTCDLVIICLPDDLIIETLQKINSNYIAYTSGSVELPSNLDKSIGVFYPLQTFRKTDELEISKVPFFIEATNKTLEQNLISLAEKISTNVSIVSSEERKKYHLSAVFINNFTNHLLYLAKKEAEKNGICWENLLSLMEETFKKNLVSNPFNNQTGPAKRNDNQTINKHISMLDGKSKEIYQLITESIKSTYHD